LRWHFGGGFGKLPFMQDLSNDETIKFFNKILKAAGDSEASDVHLKTNSPVVFRISRKLIEIDCPYPTLEWFEDLADKIIPKHAKEQFAVEKGADFSYFTADTGRFRVNLFLQRGEYAASLRLVKSEVPPFDTLGLDPMVLKLAEVPRGIIMLAGGTGCGKSTTLAAMITYINDNYRRHIVTLEDPIEFSYADNQSFIEQREVGLDLESYETGMKHALRQDPDIILVGEMRDAVSFRTAMSAMATYAGADTASDANRNG